MTDEQSRCVAHLDHLACNRERPRDDGLRRDHRRRGGQGDHGIKRPARRKQIERITHRLGCGEQQRTLAEVVEYQRRQDVGEPDQPDRATTEVTHVGVQSLRTGDRQHHAAENEKARHAMGGEEIQCMDGQQRDEDLWMLENGEHPQQGQHAEPDQHDGAEQGADGSGAMLLDGEQPDQDAKCERHDEGVQGRRTHFQTLYCGKHGDGRRDQGVAEEQRGAEKTQRHQHPAAARRQRDMSLQQREQREDAAFPLVVGAHHDADVLERYHQHQ